MNILTFDVGGTFIKYALMNEQVEILEKGKVKTPRDSQSSFLMALKSIIDQYDNLSGLAFSIPGMLDADKGYLIHGGALTYNNQCDFVGLMEAQFHLPAMIENDARCAALAEVWQGNLQDCEDGVVIVLGTGVGGAVIKDRKLHRGTHFFSGEFSYIISGDIFKDNPYNSIFGNSSSAISLVKAIGKVKQQPTMSGEEAFALLAQGDQEVQQIVDQYGLTLAFQIFNLQCILDPQRFCIGGGISQQPALIEAIQKGLDRIYARFLDDEVPHAEITVCKFLSDANLYGACYKFLQVNGNIV